MNVLLASDALARKLQSLLSEGRLWEQQAEVHVVSFSREELPRGLYDYDVVIIDHSIEESWDSRGIQSIAPLEYNLHQLSNNAGRALSQGSVIICIAGREPGELMKGIPRYQWVSHAGIELRPTRGVRTKVTKHGARSELKPYLTSISGYFAECVPKLDSYLDRYAALSLIENRNIVVALEFHNPHGGFLVVVPPPRSHDVVALANLVTMGRFYYEKAQRHVFQAEEPPWVEQYKIEEHKEISKRIQEMEIRHQKLDTTAYLLYGKGDDLVESVRITLTDLGIKVQKTEKGANVDLEPKDGAVQNNLFFEVTGSQEPVKKTSSKVGQVWQFIKERDSPDQKLIVVANAYNHLPLDQRKSKQTYTKDAVGLLNLPGILLMTTEQLYFLWKDVQEKTREAEEVREILTSRNGVLEIPRRL